MTIELTDDTRKKLIESVQRFFNETMEENVGHLRAGFVVDFCLKEIGPTIYNKAISDAQSYFFGKTQDLEGSCWEPEFTYWDAKK